MGLFEGAKNVFQNIRQMSKGSAVLSPNELAEYRTYIQTITTGQGFMPNFVNSSGEAITAETAMRISTWFTCLQVRWDALGMLPFNVFTSDGPDKKKIATDHPAQYLLHSRPNPGMTASQFWKLVQQHRDNSGNAYAPIIRDNRGNILEIDLIPKPLEVKVYKSKDTNEMYYQYNGKDIAASDILHFKGYSVNGRIGLSLTDYHAETVGRLRAIHKYSNRSISDNPGMYATSASQAPMSEPQKKAFKDYWEKEMQNYGNRGALPVLYNGFDLKTVGTNPKDALYLEQIQATKEDIYGITRVPPKLAQNYHTGNTYNNSEQQGLDFLIWTLTPMMSEIEQECDYKLFIGKESGKYHCKFNEKVLLRTDTNTQAMWLEKMMTIGAYSINDVRGFIDENPIDGGDDHFIQGNNLVPLRLLDEVIMARAKMPATGAPAQRSREEMVKELKAIIDAGLLNGRTKEIVKDFTEG